MKQHRYPIGTVVVAVKTICTFWFDEFFKEELVQIKYNREKDVDKVIAPGTELLIVSQAGWCDGIPEYTVKVLETGVVIHLVLETLLTPSTDLGVALYGQS